MPSNQTRNALAITVGVAFAVLTAAAHADGPYYPSVRVYAPPPPPFTWAGFYLGGNIGAAWSSGTLTDNLTGASFNTNNAGFIGGGQVGYNLQFDGLVLGVVSDFDWTSIDANKSVTLPRFGMLQASADTPWVTTLAARVGVAYEPQRTLVYLKAGGGWVHNTASVINLTTGTAVSASDTTGAWLLGGGVEYAFARNWFARIEYDYLGMPERTGTGPLGNTITFDRDIQMLKTGLSYKF